MSTYKIKHDAIDELTEALSHEPDLYEIQTFDGKSYRNISDGKTIIYIQVETIPFEWQISSVCVPSKNTGTGHRITELPLGTPIADVIQTIRTHLETPFPWGKPYDDLNHYLNARGQYNANPVVRRGGQIEKA